MPAVVNYAATSGSVELREVSVPEIGEQDVLLKVGAASVCGSDLHQWHGTHSWKVNYPIVLGHEFCGTIAQIGSRVRNFKEGDRVVSETAAVIDEYSPLSTLGPDVVLTLRISSLTTLSSSVAEEDVPDVRWTGFTVRYIPVFAPVSMKLTGMPVVSEALDTGKVIWSIAPELPPVAVI